MDQIEKSNLNRQFLFRKTDIGKNKAEIAKLNILKYRPDEDLDIKSYVGNIKDTEKIIIESNQDYIKLKDKKFLDINID